MIKRSITLGGTFHFEAGGSLEGLEIAFHTSKEEYNGTDKVIWICHARTADSNPEDWRPQLVGPGKFFDTGKYFIACVNMLGSAYGSSGPASINPSTGKPYSNDFSKVTFRDMIRTSIEVRKHLGVNKIDLLIGSSIGGFQAAEWAIMEPDVISHLALMATDVRESAWLAAQVEAQRMALEADPTFREAASLDGGKAGLKCARAQALIEYRCYEGYCKTQSEADVDTMFSGRAASYERYQGEKLAKRFDAYSYWSLCNALDSHNVGRFRGGVDAALSTVKADTIVVAIDTDGLFPKDAIYEWGPKIPGAKLYTISSQFGHDGFLLEYDQLEKLLAPVLESL